VASFVGGSRAVSCGMIVLCGTPVRVSSIRHRGRSFDVARWRSDRPHHCWLAVFI